VAGGLVALRFLASQIVRQSTKVLMTDPYVENLSELLSATKRTGVQTILETNLRAQKAQVLQRPLGSPRRFMDFDGLMFVSAHLDRQPLPHTTGEHRDNHRPQEQEAAHGFHTAFGLGHGLPKSPL